MRALITGAAGFIGSHLVDRLLADGHEVVGLDDLSAGARENLPEETKRFTFIEGSASNSSVVKPLVADVDAVFHLAAVVGVKLFARATPAAILSNLHSVETVLEAAAERRLPLFFASSSEVYGAADGVCAEDAPLTLGPSHVPRWSYAATKLTGEHLVLASAHHGGARSVVGRFFNTVGPRQSERYGMVLPTFVRAALRGQPLLVHGDGQQRRSFTSVHDVVAWLPRLLAAPTAVGGIFNLGSSLEASVLELAQTVKRLASSDSEIRLVPYAEAFVGAAFEDPRRRVPDLRRMHALLGTHTERTLDAIVHEVIDTERSRA